jgi:hypothetical protein
MTKRMLLPISTVQWSKQNSRFVVLSLKLVEFTYQITEVIIMQKSMKKPNIYHPTIKIFLEPAMLCHLAVLI